MKLLFKLSLLGAILVGQVAFAQQKNTDSLRIFESELPLDMTLSTDLKKLISEKKKGEYQVAAFTIKLPDSSAVTEEIQIKTRGDFRREYCYIPPLKLNFKNNTSPKTRALHQLKLVTPCRGGEEFEQYVIREYLVYRIFNLLTPMSFHVRLLKINFIDNKGKKKPFISYGFVVEDVDDMAKRNDCKEAEIKNLATEATDRDFMTLTALFQYMIGNTDWAVPVPHNIKFLSPKKTPNARPYAVPYDFDYCGLVNTPYAVPSPELGTTTVTERVYRGFPRTMEELQFAISIFNEQKDKIYALIRGTGILASRHKREMTDYLDEFYRIISDSRQVKAMFIDGARRN